MRFPKCALVVKGAEDECKKDEPLGTQALSVFEEVASARVSLIKLLLYLVAADMHRIQVGLQVGEFLLPKRWGGVSAFRRRRAVAHLKCSRSSPR